MTVSIVTPNRATRLIDRPTLLGRHASSDVVIDDPLASERHAQLSPSGDAIEVLDLGSTNGTFLNGTRIIGPRLARGGDVIRIGTFEVLVHGQAALAGATTSGLLLTVRTGVDQGAEVTIAPGQSILIGRSEQADLHLSDPLVSSNHCQISLSTVGNATFCSGCSKPIASGEAFCTGCGKSLSAAEVKDLGSANGLLVNGTPVMPGHRLAINAGTELQLGDTVITVAAIGAPTPAGPAPTMFRPMAPPVQRPPELPPPTLPQAAATRRTITLPAIDLSRLPARPAVVLAAAIGGGALLILVLVTIVGAFGDDTHDAAWIRSERGPATVQIAAFPSSQEWFVTGSGSVIDAEEGFVLTNFHVLADNSTVPSDINLRVRRDNSETWVRADVIGYSGCDDLALIQIGATADRDGLQSVEFGNGDETKVGSTVMALGFPGTLESLTGATEQMTVTQGIVSKTGVSIENYKNLMQIDADINQGSSGGPLFDAYGRQIGVNTLAMTEAQGVNYAISSARVQQLLPDLEDGMMRDQSGCS